ncbi:cation:proton antiporter [Paracoccus caeni]|uniref:Cation:proton antiporter n=1 Tax=Paracoccus caeni TaxID=657651 RepID=A0A934SDT8_9RHOB|nr:monovalent cation/H(+) antiporter subunit G [Paracoccus caeni]MBK4216042.1 cation:proton antiporter [Paracoccus caeni]
MNALDNIPLWIAILASFFVVLGATLTLIGALGFARLERFYDRIHAPTLGTSWGTGGIIIASAILASHFEGRFIFHELVIGFCVMVTIPVTLMLLGRAALHRDRAENSPILPPEMRDGPIDTTLEDPSEDTQEQEDPETSEIPVTTAQGTVSAEKSPDEEKKGE